MPEAEIFFLANRNNRVESVDAISGLMVASLSYGMP